MIYMLGIWSRLTTLTDHHQSSHILTSSLTCKTEMEVHKLKQAGVLTMFVLEKMKTSLREQSMICLGKKRMYGHFSQGYLQYDERNLDIL